MQPPAPLEDFHVVLEVSPRDAHILIIGHSVALEQLQRNAIAASYGNVLQVASIAEAERRVAHYSLNLVISDLPPPADCDIGAHVAALSRLSPGWAPVIVCVVRTEEERKAVLRAGAHNAWLEREQAVFPERLWMNARMGLLQQRLVQQHQDLSARIDARTIRLERAITVLKQAESHLRAELEHSKAASRHKSEFVAHVSHELRNPLNAILGFSEIMSEEMFGPLGNERYQSHARTIHSASKHLLSIVNGLLDLAKAEAGKLELLSEKVQVQRLVHDTVELLAQQAADAGITLSVNIEPELPEIESDAGKVRQILINLLSNAIKFTPNGGRVTVSARRDERSGVMVVVVTDTGIGIAPHDLDRIMQPYVQAPNPGSGAPGTGLGLPITKQFIELLGGSLDVESQAGVGTVFTIRLPLERPLGPPMSNNAAARPAQAPNASAPAPRPATKPVSNQLVSHPIARRTAGSGFNDGFRRS